MLQTSIALHRADLIPTGNDTGLKLLFARNLEEVREAQRLRFRIFNQEYGAHIGNPATGLDTDRFDLYCEHLLVFDEERDEVVGTYRMLMPEGAKRLGGYYSEQEFDLSGPMSAGGRVMELGRSCVHPDYRNGGTISLLWHGIAAAMERHNIDFLMGCARSGATGSAPSTSGSAAIWSTPNTGSPPAWRYRCSMPTLNANRPPSPRCSRGTCAPGPRSAAHRLGIPSSAAAISSSGSGRGGSRRATASTTARRL